KARSSARAALPSRAKAPRPCSRRSRRPLSACRSSACGSSRATPTTRPMAAAPGPRARPASAGSPPRPAATRRARPWPAPPLLPCAASILQATPEDLDIRNGAVVERDSGSERLPLHELARIAYFRPDTLPPGFQAELMATRHYVPRAWPFAFTNGVQASYLEV